jgi:hypothetical protein
MLKNAKCARITKKCIYFVAKLGEKYHHGNKQKKEYNNIFQLASRLGSEYIVSAFSAGIDFGIRISRK